MGGDESKPNIPDVIALLTGQPPLDPRVAPKKDAAVQTQHSASEADKLAKSGGHDPNYISRIEEFASMSHQEIVDRVESMLPGVMHTAAQAWKKTGDGVLFNSMGLVSKIKSSVAQGWEGATADAIVAATQRFTNEITDMQTVIQSVTMRIESAAYGAEVVKVQVPPVPSSLPNPIFGGVDSPAQVVAQQTAQQEAHDAAVWAMRNHYVPTYEPAGQSVPTFVAPTGPNDGLGTSSAGSPGSTPGSVPTSTSPSGQPSTSPSDQTQQDNQQNTEQRSDKQNSDSPASTNEQQTEKSPTSTTPTSTSPTSTTPTGVDPSTTRPTSTTSTDTSGRPGSHVPSTNAPSTVANPGGPGRSVSGPRTVSGTGSPSSTSATAARSGTTGTSGVPGMMSPGARGKSENENEHKYRRELLVHERNKIDLLGERPPTPPAVLGADAAPPPNDWSGAGEGSRPEQGERSR